MKKFTLFLIALLSFNFLHAQFQIISLDKVEEIKNSKLVVGLTGDKAIDDAIIAAVNEFWEISEIGEPMPVDEALQLAKNDNSITVIKTGEKIVMSPTHTKYSYQSSTKSIGTKDYTSNSFDKYSSYQTVTISKTLELSNGKTKPSFTQYIPTFGEEENVTQEIIAFGISAMNYQLKLMSDNHLPVTKIKGQYKKYSPELKSAKLLIPEGWVDKKTTSETIKEYYNANAEIVTYDVWRKAILNREYGDAYVMICPYPMGNGYVYQHYLMDAKTGNVYAVLQNPGASVKIGFGKSANLSKGNSGYVNKKNLEDYNNVLEGKW